ncbi:hypothetical protein JHD50_05265 [Sulfurimonas sp. MAG313]|nr:hypothetical protein [Sulfurimonas sp. MAG313]MDF1880718.1 hypothetical protein [Sulfurimonas sp. MAG313]
MNTLIINDVFPLVQIPDNSLVIFLSFLVVGTALICVGGYLVYNKLLHKKMTQTKKYLKILRNCDFENTKQSAYQISYYGRLLSANEKEKNVIEEIISELSSYKYQKKPLPISNELKEKLQNFISCIESRNV